MMMNIKWKVFIRPMIRNVSFCLVFMEFFCIISAWNVFYISFVKLCYGLRFLKLYNEMKQLQNTCGGVCQALLLLFLISRDLNQVLKLST